MSTSKSIFQFTRNHINVHMLVVVIFFLTQTFLSWCGQVSSSDFFLNGFVVPSNMFARTHSIYLLIKSFTRILLTNLLASLSHPCIIHYTWADVSNDVAQVHNNYIKNIVKFMFISPPCCWCSLSLSLCVFYACFVFYLFRKKTAT